MDLVVMYAYFIFKVTVRLGLVPHACITVQ